MSNGLYDEINQREYARFCARSDMEYARVVAGAISSEDFSKWRDHAYDEYCADVARLYSEAIVGRAEKKLKARLAELDGETDDTAAEAESDPPTLITADESARLLNCTRATLFAAIRAGRIQPPNEDGLFDLDYIRKVPPARGKPKQRPRGQTVVPDNVYTSIWKF